MVRQHEDRDLEFVVADVPIGIVGHLERAPPHDHGAGPRDQPVHVGGPVERLEIRIETSDAALLVGDESVERRGHPDDDLAQSLTPSA